jgi:molybdopterin biosynthesis enzyme
LTFFPRGRAAFEGEKLIFTPGSQQSSMQIGSWAAVNAVARIEPGEGKLGSGDQVDVLVLGPL